MTATKIMERLPADVLAYFTHKVALSAAISSSGLTTTAVEVGAMIEEELRLCAFEGAEPALYRTIERQLSERGAGAGHARRVFVFTANKANVELPRLTRAEKLHVGVKLIELMIETTGFIESVHIRTGRKTQVRLRPTDKVGAWINDRNLSAALTRPRFLPMVERPRDWTGTTGGGYLTSAIRALPIVKRAAKPQQAALETADMSVVYRALNAIQSTGWRVNGPVLDVLEKAWDRGLTGALPNREDTPLPAKPAAIANAVTKEQWLAADPDIKKEWKIAARRVHEHNATTRGKRVNIAQIISTAGEMRNDPQIFFPHQLDFRGRAYAVPIGLNPQGSDAAKALLTFSEGKPITDERAAGWLGIHGANMFGFDKVSFADRVDWAFANRERIIHVANDPFGDLWWTEADKPWCFLSWCFEWQRFLQEGYGYVCTYPTSVDGSCNGLQHFSAMLRDPVGGAAVNLVPAPLPSDIYQRVADRVIERLHGLVNVVSDDPMSKDEFTAAMYAAGWLAFGIDRKVTKRPVMVLPYGGTFRSCLEYVREAVVKKIAEGKENPFGDDLGKATAFLAKLTWESIGDVVVAARTAMDWLQKVARVAAKRGLSLSWTTPSGFPAYQAYRDVRHRRVKTKLQGSLVYLSLTEEGDKLDRDRQALGISPNFVHSLDASAMMLTIALSLDNGVSQFAMIHDSYGTVPADMDMLSACLREAFVDMYQEHNVLQEFLAGLPPEVQAECPPVPPMGSLALASVLQSDFFFA